MGIDSKDILSVLDSCCESYSFPMLDNGYFYLAATRMSLYRNPSDWAIVIETFGFSPRQGVPSNYIHTFGSKVRRSKAEHDYVDKARYENHIAHHPNDEFSSVDPLSGYEHDYDNEEIVAHGAVEAFVRDQRIPLPGLDEYAAQGIEAYEPGRVRVFELCRYVAALYRDAVLATEMERRVNLTPGMELILQLEEWHHPNLVDGELASSSETFQQLAEVLATGDVNAYLPSLPPNTHWKNWPDGGLL